MFSGGLGWSSFMVIVLRVLLLVGWGIVLGGDVFWFIFIYG